MLDVSGFPKVERHLALASVANLSDSSDSTCSSQMYGSSSLFWEEGGKVVIARDFGSKMFLEEKLDLYVYDGSVGLNACDG